MNVLRKISRLKSILIGLEDYLGSSNAEVANRKSEFTQIIRAIDAKQDLQSKNELDYLFLRVSDLSRLLIQDQKVNWRIETNKPIAIDSNDHIHPRGVKQDETRRPAFVQKLIGIYGPGVTYLDLGCAGGGLVYDFVIKGCLALGLEGSDFSKSHSRAYWHEIPWALHTADLTAPVKIFLENQPATFDVIGAWEFFEHIDEEDIDSVLRNIKHHLRNKRSLFLANIATFEDSHEGTHWHSTIKPKDWWEKKFTNFGFDIVAYPFDSQFNPRGSGNTLGTWGNDYDIIENPNLGFSIAAKLK